MAPTRTKKFWVTTILSIYSSIPITHKEVDEEPGYYDNDASVKNIKTLIFLSMIEVSVYFTVML